MDNRALGSSDRAFEKDMVRELLSRTAGSRYGAGRRPVLVFTGGAATGKTRLVTEIAKGGWGRFPVAFLDLEVVEPVLGEHPVPGLLAAVAAQMAVRSTLYGSLRFDRLVVGLLVIEADLVHPDPDTRRARVLEILKERRGVSTLKRVLGEVAKKALAQMPAPFAPSSELGTMAVDAVVDAAAAWRLTRRGMLGRYQEWFGDQDEERGLAPVDVLIWLNSAYRPGARPDEAQEADDLLWRAFLADLRDNFRRARHPEDWTWTALLLLDGADTALGRDFLHRLVQSLDADVALRSGLETPLTVVVTSRGGVFEELTRVQAAAVCRVTDPADMPSASTDPSVVWLARRLPSFSVGQVYDIVRGSGLPMGDARNLTTMLHQFAGGHPFGTHEVLQALAGGVALVELEKLLTTKAKECDPPLGDRILDRLLARFPEDAIERLILASAGRTGEEGKRLLARSDGIRVPVPDGMWDAATPTSLLRVLLLRRLAHDPDGWRNAHEGLRRACAEKDPHGELHHLLALDQADEVVQRLADQLNPDHVMDWLALLDAAACAPIRDRQAPPAPAVAVTPAFVRTLLVDTRRVSDPLCGPDRHGPYFRVANAYRDLARHLADSGDPEGMAEVDERIDRFDALARQWRRFTSRPH